MHPPVRQTLRVAATPQGIRQAVEAFDRFRSDCGLQGDDVWQVQIALDELLVNTVSHAYGDRTDGVVDLVFALENGELELTIVDDGPAFNPLALPPPDIDSPLEKRKAGGLGVHLLKNLMSRVDYAHRDGRNRMVCARLLTGAGARDGITTAATPAPAKKPQEQ